MKKQSLLNSSERNEFLQSRHVSNDINHSTSPISHDQTLSLLGDNSLPRSSLEDLELLMKNIQFGSAFVDNIILKEFPAERNWDRFILQFPASKEVEPPITASENKAPEPSCKSWADLVRAADGAKSKSIERHTSVEDSIQHLSMKQICDMRYEEIMAMDKYPAQIVPRGLVNNGNFCFMNAILQPLVYCRPLIVLFELVRRNTVKNLSMTKQDHLTLIEAMIIFYSSFNFSSDVAQPDTPFSPSFVYEALRQHRQMETSRGTQEDAEEFLGFLLDGLHEQFLLAVGNEQGHSNLQDDRNSSSEDGIWVEIGHNSKPCVTREIGNLRSPITTLFEGQIRSVMRAQHGHSKERVVVEPFRALHVDVSSAELTTLEGLLERNFAPESISGTFMATQHRQLLLESLPPILILHLKRFVFAEAMVQKVRRFVLYPQVLHVNKRWMSAACLSKSSISSANVKYKLTAVVYHHGTTASGGHYTTDLMVSSSGDRWISVDDDLVFETNIAHVLEPKTNQQAYLLFYSRS